jgi:hypothetical protein
MADGMQIVIVPVKYGRRLDVALVEGLEDSKRHIGLEVLFELGVEDIGLEAQAKRHIVVYGAT